MNIKPRTARTLALALVAAPVVAVMLSGCLSDDSADERPGADFDAFVPLYNRYIANWLANQSAAIETSLAEVDAEIAAEQDPEAKKGLEDRRAQVESELERIKGRQELGDYFQFKTPADLPADLVWEDGQDQPDIGDPACKKGGAFRYFIPAFPPTIRPFGPGSNNSFRGELYDNVEVGLVDLHPQTGAIIPGVASEWAESEDGRTVFFKLDPDARYNDGVDIKAVDFMWYVYVRVSDNVESPFFSQYLREQFAQLTTYGEEIVAVTLPSPRPKLPYFCNIPPTPPHFYEEYGPDYEDLYRWRVPPTSAAYTIRDGGIKKGASLTLTRVDDWWAKDKKFYRYRYNADNLVYLVVRDRSKAWELFRAGEIDYFPVSLPKYWYEKAEIPPVFDGYIERYTWYNQYPRIPWSLYLNTAKPPLDNRDVRLGIAHATNWQKVIDIIFRGDASRLPGWTKGYGEIDNPAIEARPFSITKAREYFAKAGYTEGADGIMRNAAGEPLQVTITFTADNVRKPMMAILEEEAAKAGLDFILDGLDGTRSFNKVSKKEHQIAFTGWGFQPPYPRYYEYFHSSNAYDEKGNLKLNTNNIFSFKDERMDQLSIAYRFATDEEELIRLAHEMQQIVHDSGVYIPGWMTEFARVACWRWVRWPDSEELTEFAPPLAYIPMESYVYWIDQEMKAETVAARRSGKTFPEVQEVKQRYRTQ